MEEKQTELGTKVKDKVTGLEGIVIAKCIYLNGCIQFEIAPAVNEKGETIKTQWIDQQQLEFVDHGILPNPKPEPKKRSVIKFTARRGGGGFRSHPD